MAVVLFKRLAQKVHNSAFCKIRIKRELKKPNECKDKPDDETPVVYRKTIQSVATRCSSTCFLMEPISNLPPTQPPSTDYLQIIVQIVLELNQGQPAQLAQLYVNFC